MIHKAKNIRYISTNGADDISQDILDRTIASHEFLQLDLNRPGVVIAHPDTYNLRYSRVYNDRKEREHAAARSIQSLFRQFLKFKQLRLAYLARAGSFSTYTNLILHTLSGYII